MFTRVREVAMQGTPPRETEPGTSSPLPASGFKHGDPSFGADTWPLAM